MPCARESQGRLEQKREAPRRLIHRTLCNALKICKLGGTSESSKRYYRIELNESTEVFLQFYGTNIKADMGDGEIFVVGASLIFANDVPPTNWKAVAIDIDTPTYSPTGNGIISFREQIEMQGGNVDDLADAGLISITKEQFYTLE